jgi:GWxTD domain-containing protein
MAPFTIRYFFISALCCVSFVSSSHAQDSTRKTFTREIEAIILGGGGYFSYGKTFFQPTASGEFLAQTSAFDLSVGYHYGFSKPATEGLHIGLRFPISRSATGQQVFADAGLLLFDAGFGDPLQAGLRADLGGRTGLLEYRAAMEIRHSPFGGTLHGAPNFSMWGGLELGIAIPVFHRTLHEPDRKDTLRAELRAIATSEELEALENTRSNREIDKWVEDFWSTHVFKGTTGDDAKVEYMRRADTANKRFGTPYRIGAGTDMGRVYMIFGQPDAIEPGFSTTNPDRKYEMWTYYARLAGHQTAIFLFVQFNGGRSDAGRFGATSYGQTYVGLGGYKQIYSNVRGEDTYPIPGDLPADMLNFIQSH